MVALSGKDYETIIAHLSELGIIGGATYDALILHAAANANVDQVVTFNEKDFHRLYPEMAKLIVSP